MSYQTDRKKIEKKKVKTSKKKHDKKDDYDTQKKIESRRQLIFTSNRQYKFAQAYRNIVVVKVDSLYKKKDAERERERKKHAFLSGLFSYCKKTK
jgi:hypothetical protein